MPQNGEISTRFGVYKNVCCGVEVIVREGAAFPDCKNHPNLTTLWKAIDLAESAEAKVHKSRRSA